MSTLVTKCRCCLSVDVGMKDMCSESLQSGKLKLIDGFTVCSGIADLGDNTDVVHICYACEFQLKNAFLFRKMCLDSDETLKNSTNFVKVEVPERGVQPLDSLDDNSENNLVAVPSDIEEDAKSDLSDQAAMQSILMESKEENDSEEEMMVEALDEYVEEVKKTKNAKVANSSFADDANLEDISEPEMAVDDATMDLEAEFYCFVCSQYLPNYRAFAVHRGGHDEQIRKRQCEFCQETVSGYTKHLWLEHPEFKPYKCSLCKFTASRAINLKRHLYGHIEEKSYKCLLCDISFKSAAQLRAHTTTSTKRHCNNGYNCPYCGLAYHKVLTFVDHIRDKHPEVKARLLPCYDCKRPFHSRKTYEEHLATCENLASKKGLVKKSDQSAEKQCMLCQTMCVDEEHLNCHDLIYHGLNEDAGATCEECHKTFPTAATYKRHMVCHSAKDYQCDQCGLCLNSVSRLKKHKLTHSDVRNVQCGVCNARFKHKHNLKTHEKIHGPKSKDNECNECGKLFTTVGQLKLHMAVHFQELKVHACDLCDRRFVRAVDKEKHMRTHRGERNYKCEMCSKSYFTQFALKDHVIRVHAEFRFECKFCNKKYARNKSLYEHIFTHKNVKPYTCPACQAQYVKKELFKKHMKKRHGIEYSEALHGYSETFQEVLMFGLKTEKDPDQKTSDVTVEPDEGCKLEDSGEIHETEATDDEDEIGVDDLVNDDEIIEYPDLTVHDL